MKHINIKYILVILLSVGIQSIYAQTWQGAKVDNGDFFLYNVGTGQYLTNGNAWGTQATSGINAIPVTLKSLGENQYSISTNSFYSGKFLGKDGYIDQASFTWTFIEVESGTGGYVYNISNGSTYLGVENPTAGCAFVPSITNNSLEGTKWKLVSKSTSFETATYDNGIDVSMCILNPKYSKYNNKDRYSWSNTNGGPGTQENNGIVYLELYAGWESGSPYDFNQTITNMPNGKYALICNGFYRNGDNGPANTARDNGTESLDGKIYINNESASIMSIFEGAGKNGNNVSGDYASTLGGTPNNLERAVSYIQTGCYDGNRIEAIVTDGTLKIGFKNSTNLKRNWIVTGPLQLIYYGVDLTELQNTLANAIANAKAIEQTSIPNTAYATLQSAISTAEGSEINKDALNTAITNINNAIDAAKSLQLPYDKINSLITLCTNYENNSISIASDATTFNDAIAAATTTANEATTADALNSAYSTLETARQNYVKVAYPNAGFSFDMTFMMNNPAVTSASGWTNGRKNENQQYTGAPDNTYLDSWDKIFDQYQTVKNLPEGLYSITAATRGSATLPVGYIYTKSDNVTVKADIWKKGGSGNTLGNGWDWTTTDPISVTSTLTIGFYSECGGQQWAGADNFTLSRTYDPTSTQLSVTALVEKAKAQNVQPMGSVESSALTDAANNADATNTNPFELKEYITALNTAIDNANTWLTNYNTEKAKVVAVLERFERDYNDGQNGPINGMSTEAWTTLLAKVQAAAEAKDVTNSYDGFATAVTELEAAMTTADASIATYATYNNWKTTLNNVNATTFAEVITLVSGETYIATDEKVKEATSIMGTALKAYAAQQTTSFDISAVLGGNLDFETPQAAATDALYPNVYEQPEWLCTYSLSGNGKTNDWVYRNTEVTDRTDAAANTKHIRLRTNWQPEAGTMQITKATILPEGNYTLTFYIKQTESAGQKENLNYYSIAGTKNTFTASSSWEKKVVSFEVTAESEFELSFGFVGDKDNKPTNVFVDDITLTCEVKSEYQRTLEAAQSTNTNEPSSAIQAALNEYTYSPEEEKSKTAEEITLATNVLNNAITIASNNEDATSLWKNADFAAGTQDYPAPAGGRIVKAPKDWTFAYTLSGWGEVVMMDDAFNVWSPEIQYAELSQTIGNLPNGTYKMSADVKTSANTEQGGKILLAIYGAPKGGDVARSINVGNPTDEFSNYTTYAKVVQNELTIGIRTDYNELQASKTENYFQVKNFKIEFVADNAQEVDNGKLYQEAYVKRNNLELDLTAFTNANGCKVYCPNPNTIVYANAEAVTNTQNVVANGTCDNLIITDGSPVSITNGFTATNASYKRTMANNWGTIYLPYAVTSNDDVTYYELNAVTDNVMTFSAIETLDANTPGAFKKGVAEATEVILAGSNVEVSATSEGNQNTAVTNWAIHGSFEAKTIDVTTDPTNNYYYIASNKFWRATGIINLAPYRAYFTSGTASESNYRIDINDGTTGINGTESNNADLTVFGDNGQLTLEANSNVDYTVYNVNGQLIAKGTLTADESRTISVAAGIYVVNGAKVIVK